MTTLVFYRDYFAGWKWVVEILDAFVISLMILFITSVFYVIKARMGIDLIQNFSMTQFTYFHWLYHTFVV